MTEKKSTREGSAIDAPDDTPTQEDVDAAVAAEADAGRNAQEAALEEADTKLAPHGANLTRSE